MIKQAERPFIIAAMVCLLSFGWISALTVLPDRPQIPLKPSKIFTSGKVVKPNRTRPELQTGYNATIGIISPQGRVIGSGVILRHKKGKTIQVLTAYHIVKDLFPHKVLFGKLDTGDIHSAIVTKINEGQDLALLETIKIAQKDGPSAKLAKEEPVLGDAVWVIGNPRQIIGNVTRGILSNILTVEDGTTYYRIDAAIFFGNSGGGVYNEKGELIGIAHAVETLGRATLVPGGGLIISLPTIKMMLQQ